MTPELCRISPVWGSWYWDTMLTTDDDDDDDDDYDDNIEGYGK